MKVHNLHERTIAAPEERVAALLDSLASEDDRLWPADSWPAMRLDRGLVAGAVGGHGPIRYILENREPGRSVRFRFTKPAGFDGYHEFAVEAESQGSSRLRHVIRMDATGSALLRWHLVFRPLHDALIEDALDRAQVWCGAEPERRRWSLWVRFLRWFMAAGRRHRLR